MAVPPDFVCPISREVMVEPVLLVETGHTYEKEALYTWWRSSGRPSCPKTGVQLSSLLVAPNWTLRGAIETWKANQAASASASACATPGSQSLDAQGTMKQESADLSSHPLTLDLDAELQHLQLDDDVPMGDSTPAHQATTATPTHRHLAPSLPATSLVARPLPPGAPPPTITVSAASAAHPTPGARGTPTAPAGTALLGGGPGAEGAPPGWTFFPGLDSPGGDIGLAPAPALAHIATGSVGGEGSQGGQCGADTTGAGAGPRVGSGEGTSLSEALGCAQSRLAGLRGEPRMPSTLGESSQGGQAAEAEDMNVDSAEPEGAAALPPTSGAGSSSSISSHLAQLCARLPGVVPAPPPTSTEPGGSRGGTSISASSSHDWWLTAPIVAFNTNGWVKALLQPMHGWVKWTAEAGKGLFVRNDVLLALMQGVLAHMQGSQSAPVQLAGWTFFHGLDSLGGDVAWAWQHAGMPSDLARVAGELPGVVAFNTDGYLKTALHPRREWVTVEAWGDKPGSGLYVHNSILWKLLVA